MCSGGERHLSAVSEATRRDILDHLGPKNPAGALRCAIWVNDLGRGWQKGATLIFDDTFVHRGRNDSNTERVGRFAAFERSLPWPSNIINRALMRSIAKTTLTQQPLEWLLRQPH